MDRITLEVLGSALVAIAEEMGIALIRSSYSSNIKERWDCSTAIFDREGEVIAQAEHIPLHLGSLLGVVREVLRRYPSEALKPGDVFAANDPYTGGGTHLPDITVVAPVFVEGELFGFVANIAHHADRTGAVIRSIFDEGLRITPFRIVEAHQVREDVMELLLANFALPTQRQGDFRAQIAANRLGERRVLELCRRYGAETVRKASAEYLQYAERKIRAAIRGIPDGVYRYTDYMDGDGIQPGPIPIALAMSVTGDRVRLDFSGTGPQVAGDINVVWLALLATAYYALKAILDPTIPANGGFYRAIEVEAPEGSIVNARPPAAVGWRSQTCQRIADVIFGALALAVPDRVPAAGNGANTAWTFAGTDPKAGRYPMPTGSMRSRSTPRIPRTFRWNAWRPSIRCSSRRPPSSREVEARAVSAVGGASDGRSRCSITRLSSSPRSRGRRWRRGDSGEEVPEVGRPSCLTLGQEARCYCRQSCGVMC